MSQFTPGPWKACQDGGCSCGTIFGADGNTTVGRAYGEDDLEHADQVPTREMHKANIRLIAAAPDLLTAAQKVSDLSDQIYVQMSDNEARIMQVAWRELDAAIAKATGKT